MIRKKKIRTSTSLPILFRNGRISNVKPPPSVYCPFIRLFYIIFQSINIHDTYFYFILFLYVMSPLRQNPPHQILPEDFPTETSILTYLTSSLNTLPDTILISFPWRHVSGTPSSLYRRDPSVVPPVSPTSTHPRRPPGRPEPFLNSKVSHLRPLDCWNSPPYCTRLNPRVSSLEWRHTYHLTSPTISPSLLWRLFRTHRPLSTPTESYHRLLPSPV